MTSGNGGFAAWGGVGAPIADVELEGGNPMTRMNCYAMCLALLTSLAGCYATVGHEHARRPHREVVVREVHYDHHHEH